MADKKGQIVTGEKFAWLPFLVAYCVVIKAFCSSNHMRSSKTEKDHKKPKQLTRVHHLFLSAWKRVWAPLFPDCSCCLLCVSCRTPWRWCSSACGRTVARCWVPLLASRDTSAPSTWGETPTHRHTHTAYFSAHPPNACFACPLTSFNQQFVKTTQSNGH